MQNLNVVYLLSAIKTLGKRIFSDGSVFISSPLMLFKLAFHGFIEHKITFGLFCQDLWAKS